MAPRFPLQYIFVVYLVLLLAATFVPYGQALEHMGRINDLYFRLDYLLHALLFLVLVPLWAWAMPAWRRWQIVAAALVLAIMAEGAHYFLAYRSFNPVDMLANGAGVLLGAGLMMLLPRQPALPLR